MIKMIVVKPDQGPNFETPDERVSDDTNVLMIQQVHNALSNMKNFSLDCFVNAVSFDIKQSLATSTNRTLARAYH
jgi:hypothetical protein